MKSKTWILIKGHIICLTDIQWVKPANGGVYVGLKGTEAEYFCEATVDEIWDQLIKARG